MRVTIDLSERVGCSFGATSRAMERGRNNTAKYSHGHVNRTLLLRSHVISIHHAVFTHVYN